MICDILPGMTCPRTSILCLIATLLVACATGTPDVTDKQASEPAEENDFMELLFGDPFEQHFDRD